MSLMQQWRDLIDVHILTHMCGGLQKTPPILPSITFETRKSTAPETPYMWWFAKDTAYTCLVYHSRSANQQSRKSQKSSTCARKTQLISPFIRRSIAVRAGRQVLD